ncbi:phosphoadenosine phosphosulfate reductase [Marinactinospora rubrisoli]|uniref:Phosphoadenosine phosphosulfate reductase n=1 Tax=Marinactinospora rubrisoli TaxID=2715399 RepID=A0ABW2KQ30_9ACTN
MDPRPARRGLGVDVLTAAKTRISRVFDDFARVYVSFSGGKDSGVLLELAAQEARRRGRRIGVLFVDLEAQYAYTVGYIQQMLDRHADVADPYWVALPLNLRNAVSQFEPQWMCWEPGREQDWVRPRPQWQGATPARGGVITDEGYFPFFRRGMEFEEFTPEFGDWYSDGKLTACLVGIRTQESLNRWRTIASQRKRRHEDWAWTTWIADTTVYNAYPLYDWKTEDIWRFYGKTKTPYNQLYDRMHQAGLTIHQARICQPYGDDQRKGLWLYHVIEPHTWSRVVARVNGANFGAIYARESGNVLGRIKIAKPDGLTWEEFAHRLLASMPAETAEHYRDKISGFLHWYETRGYPGGSIPDEGPASDKRVPSWTRICKVLLSNDYWCKGMSFSPQNRYAQAQYKALQRRRRAEWNYFGEAR